MSRSTVLVIGDLMIDQYLWGKCERISPEAPVPVVDIQKESATLGGAGNVINNLQDLDLDVIVLSVVGDDDPADEIREMFVKRNISTDHLIVEKGRKTSKKTRIIATHQQMLRYDRETKTAVGETSKKQLLNIAKELITHCDLVLLSDYNKGVLTPEVSREVIEISNRAEKKALADPKGKDYSKYRGSYLITPNRKEAGEATGMTLETMEDVEKAGRKLREEHNLEYTIITLSEEGMAVIGNEMHIIPTRAREVFDVTGAGDTVLAALGYGLVKGMDINSAARFANEAAAVVVAKIGAATATLKEIEEYEKRET